MKINGERDIRKLLYQRLYKNWCSQGRGGMKEAKNKAKDDFRLPPRC
jgi:hypothetical protein